MVSIHKASVDPHPYITAHDGYFYIMILPNMHAIKLNSFKKMAE